jgi:hypothetical protein
MLNRANQAAVSAAVEALPLTHGDTVADLGFGGGVGLDLLLRHVGTSGHVDGVDASWTIGREEDGSVDMSTRRLAGQTDQRELLMGGVPVPGGPSEAEPGGGRRRAAKRSGAALISSTGQFGNTAAGQSLDKCTLRLSATERLLGR